MPDTQLSPQIHKFLTENTLSDAEKLSIRNLIGANYTLGNASVNAAIATNPVSSRDAMESLERNTSLRGLKNSINTASSTGDFAISAILIGDSFAATGSLYDFRNVTREVGSYRCGALAGGGDSGVTNINDYSKSPSGTYQQVASGGNLTCGHLQTGLAGLASHGYYTFFNGTGTAQLQYKKGAGAWTNLGASIDTTLIANVSIGSIALPDVSSNYAIRVTATGGTVNGWIGQGMDGPGLTCINFATAGHGIEQVADVSETIWKAMVSAYKAGGASAQLLICTFADYRFTGVATTAWPTKGVPSWSASSPAQTLHDWSRTANALIDWVVIGPHQVSTANVDGTNALVDAAFSSIGIGSNLNDRTLDGSRAQRDFATRNKTAWADCVYLTDYATGNAEGLYGDTVHLNAKGQDYKRSHVFRETNLGWLISPIQYTTGFRIGQVRLGATRTRSGTPSLVAYLASSNDVALAPITSSAFRCGDSVSPEQQGMQFMWVSSSLASIGAYNAGGNNSNFLEIGYNGAGISLRPSQTASSQLGTSTRPWEQLFIDKTITAPGTTGARTIDKQSGRVNFAATDTSLVVTSARVTANSIIVATVATNDTTLKSVIAVAAAGSFTLHANAAATAETAVNFFISN